MKSDWFNRSSLTIRESAWILIGIDPDEPGPENEKSPTDPLRQASAPGHVIQHFGDYLHWLNVLYRDVALGVLPLVREPWNRFPLCFVRIGHLATWCETACPQAADLWHDHGVIKEILPPPPPEWLSPDGEGSALAKARNHMIQRAAERLIKPMMKDEMDLLSQWLSSSGSTMPLNDIKNALRPLYKELRNLPVL
ncbi:MAG: hypothetical protein HQL73_05970 [Magnetococcales bacterium]|nr:hypothetical protein [Magnetococcales bacterium]